VGSGSSALILGDNIFYGHSFGQQLARVVQKASGATVFAYHVRDPERYGVVEFDATGRAVGIEEKPTRPASHYVVTGLYFYDNQVLDIARSLRPSKRGEMEITDVNKHYLAQRELNVEVLGRDMAWLDAGTHEAFVEASTFIETIERRQGLKVTCPEEIAYRMGYISDEQLEAIGTRMQMSSYGQYLLGLLRDHVY
jgi:glucose-1-phosphate thymidylyltransferase